MRDRLRISLVGLDDLLVLDLKATAPPELVLDVLARPEPTWPTFQPLDAHLVVVDMDCDPRGAITQALSRRSEAIPVLALAGGVRPGLPRPLAAGLELARQSGAAKALPKPIDAADLITEALDLFLDRTPKVVLTALALRANSSRRT